MMGYIVGNIMVALPFHNALYGINLQDTDQVLHEAVGVYSVVCMVKQGNNHDIATWFV